MGINNQVTMSAISTVCMLRTESTGFMGPASFPYSPVRSHAKTWADKTEARYTRSQKPQHDRGGNTSLTAAAWTDPSTQSGE